MIRWDWPETRTRRGMRIDEMNRYQLEALAFRLGMSRPKSYTMPELKKALKAQYAKRKREGG